MKVLFDNIPADGLDFEIKDPAWAQGIGESYTGQPFAHINLKKINKRILVVGEFRIKLKLRCDRCLESYSSSLSSKFNFFLEYIDENNPYWNSVEHSCTENEMNVIFLSEPQVDLMHIVEQQVMLTLPTKKLCGDSCLGLCSKCGENISTGKCTCSGKDQNSPFQVLSKLKFT